MAGFFTHERFGRPQILAGLMLLAFLAQCLWLVEQGTALWEHRGLSVVSPDFEKEFDSALPSQRARAEDGSYDAYYSPLWYLIASAPLALSPVTLRPEN